VAGGAGSARCFPDYQRFLTSLRGGAWKGSRGTAQAEIGERELVVRLRERFTGSHEVVLCARQTQLGHAAGFVLRAHDPVSAGSDDPA